MSFSEISSSNFQNYIELKDDFMRYSQKYEKIESDFKELEYKIENDRLELKYRVSNLDETLGLGIQTLNEVDIYVNNRRIFEELLTIDISKNFMINESENILNELNSIIEEISQNNQDISNTDCKMKDIIQCSTAKVNPHIVHSRQTKKPFVVMFMLEASNYRCNGCKKVIPLQVPYLRHLEEYPSGSKVLKPHSYHINKDCLFVRGFEDQYLKRIRVECKEEINKNIVECLLEIGFQLKNIRMNVDSDSDNDSDDGSSQHSKEPSTTALFILRRKNATQKKKVICFSCRNEIETESYLTFDNNFEQPFHLSKKCLHSHPAVCNDFSNVKCQVFKFLRNHNELREVLACGFYFKNIIGNKPPNPSLKPKPPVSMKTPVDFIFNNEPFICERLLHAERCRGCSDSVRKEMMALRHREQVPRDKMAESPMVSQFYHPDKNCLIDRGFTNKYLEVAKCNVVLVGSDNLQKVRDMLVRCGFSSDRLSFGASDDGGKQGPMSLAAGDRGSSHSSYLFIETCSKTGAQCEGCNLPVTLNEACFLYGLSNVQDRHARLFHISKECLNRHFSGSQVLAMTCVNSNSMVDVNPMDIMRCGLVNIVTHVPANVRHNPLQRMRPRFVVDTALDIVGNCSACKMPLNHKDNKYVLRAISERFNLPVNMHLARSCVSLSGYVPSQLADSEVTYAVHVTTEARQRLMECGFKKTPHTQ